jgi:hypothetical protein
VHYNEGSWTDYVRGLAAPNLAAEMQAHLQTGCRRCAELVASLAVVEDTFSRDRANAVPDALVSRARALFRPAAAPSWRDLPRLAASLIFDSFAEPSLAGVRSAGSFSRMLSFEADELRLDVRVEQEHGAAALAVTGQISSADDFLSVAHLPIQLLQAGRIVAESQTSEFGEFHFDAMPQRDLRLAFPVANATRLLEVPLDLSAAR